MKGRTAIKLICAQTTLLFDRTHVHSLYVRNLYVAMDVNESFAPPMNVLQHKPNPKKVLRPSLLSLSLLSISSAYFVLYSITSTPSKHSSTSSTSPSCIRRAHTSLQSQGLKEGRNTHTKTSLRRDHPQTDLRTTGNTTYQSHTPHITSRCSSPLECSWSSC